jgi:hypothetical protein
VIIDTAGAGGGGSSLSFIVASFGQAARKITTAAKTCIRIQSHMAISFPLGDSHRARQLFQWI